MRCFSLVGGTVKEGIPLWQEPGKTLVHLPPSTWWAVREDLLSNPQGVVLVEDKPVLMRASVEGGQFVPEKDGENGVIVLGHITHDIGDLSGIKLPEPFYGKFGLNFCTGALYGAERIVTGAGGNRLQHEEYVFCVCLRPGDRIDARMFLYSAPNSRLWNDPEVGGTFLRFDGGDLPRFEQLRAVA